MIEHLKVLCTHCRRNLCLGVLCPDYWLQRQHEPVPVEKSWSDDRDNSHSS